MAIVKIILIIGLTLLLSNLFAEKKWTFSKQDLKDGKKIYKTYCALCHEQGSAGAPRLKNKQQWAARMKKSDDVLIKQAIAGYHLMPPKGNCYSCKDRQIANAVAYIRSQVEKKK